MDPTCHINKKKRVAHSYSSPSLEVCDTETVCGVESYTAVPHDAAQQGPQLRRDTVQCNLRGHVVHFIHSEEFVETQQHFREMLER